MSENYEYVNHPTHYNHEGRKECWDEWEDKFGTNIAIAICLGNADKYLYRAGTKKDNPAEQDIGKARMYFAKAGKMIESAPSAVSVRVASIYELIGRELEKYDHL